MRSMLEIVPIEKLSSKATEPCSICHEPMVPGEQCRRLPCFHLFHRTCIDKWLRLKGTCPLDKLLLSDMLRQQSLHASEGSTQTASTQTAASSAAMSRHRSRSLRRQR